MIKKRTRKQWLNNYGYKRKWYSSQKYYKYVDVEAMNGSIDTVNDYWLVIDLLKMKASVQTSHESINITKKEYETIGKLLEWANGDLEQMLEESVEEDKEEI